MGMTDNQFKSHRQKELRDYERMHSIAIKTNADKELILLIEELIEDAKADIER